MIKKILNFKFVIPARTTVQSGRSNYNKGMTYVELIVVLSIFSILSAVTIFNYKQFQSKVDIKNLANEIALKLVGAQKDATFGKLAPLGQQPSNPSTWKPSYGLYFDRTTPTLFYYFIDLDQNKQFVPPVAQTCPIGECLVDNPINITKGNYISEIKVFWIGGTPTPTVINDDLQITFTRPNSGATFAQSSGVLISVDHVNITISSPSGDVTSVISIYPSGRIELN